MKVCTQCASPTNNPATVNEEIVCQSCADKFKMEYFTIEYKNYILCSRYKWMNKETHKGTFFNQEEIDYMIDRWNKNGCIDTTELIIKPYIKGE